MKSVPECKHLRFYVPNWETILVVHAVAMRWGLSRVGPSVSGLRGGRRARVGADHRAHSSLRSGFRSTFLLSVEPSRTAQGVVIPSQLGPSAASFSAENRGQRTTRRPGWTTSDLRGKVLLDGRICSEVLAHFLLQKFWVCPRKKETRCGEKEEKVERRVV